MLPFNIFLNEKVILTDIVPIEKFYYVKLFPGSIGCEVRANFLSSTCQLYFSLSRQFILMAHNLFQPMSNSAVSLSL